MPFPNVPNVPGVPILPRDPGAAIAAIAFLAADAIANLIGLFGSPKWGIFLSGIPVVVAESVLTFDFKQDYTVADYPIEEGGFESYDKVQVPFDVRLRFSMGGSEADRQVFLDSIATAAASLELYEVFTPEVSYASMNITHYDYRRTATNGVGLLVVDVWLVEVRTTATATFANTKQPNVAGPQNVGTVQPTAPTAAVADRFLNFD